MDDYLWITRDANKDTCELWRGPEPPKHVDGVYDVKVSAAILIGDKLSVGFPVAPLECIKVRIAPASTAAIDPLTGILCDIAATLFSSYVTKPAEAVAKAKEIYMGSLQAAREIQETQP